MSDIITAMGTAVGTMVTDLTGGLSSLIPIILPLAAAAIGIFFLWRTVRKFVGR